MDGQGLWPAAEQEPDRWEIRECFEGVLGWEKEALCWQQLAAAAAVFFSEWLAGRWGDEQRKMLVSSRQQQTCMHKHLKPTVIYV
jgi:hypothetical protein